MLHNNPPHNTEVDVGQVTEERVLRALGTRLHKTRKTRHLTRNRFRDHLRHALGLELSSQTLATYESGTRQCTVFRWVQLCRALGEDPASLLRETVASIHLNSTTLQLDLRRTARLHDAELASLSGWAQSYLRNGGPARVPLTTTSLDHAALLCGTDTPHLLERLRIRGCLI